MAFGKIRSIIQQQIDWEYTEIKWFINDTDALFKSQLDSINSRIESELGCIDETDPDIRETMCNAIWRGYSPTGEMYGTLIFTSRRALLIAIFSYFESNLKRIYESCMPKDKNKRGKQIKYSQPILSAIEKKLGALPTEANALKNIVCEDLRLLRNHCVHQGEIYEETKAIIEKDPHLSIVDGELHIENKQVLLNYLESTKSLLEIIEEHRLRNSSHAVKKQSAGSMKV